MEVAGMRDTGGGRRVSRNISFGGALPYAGEAVGYHGTLTEVGGFHGILAEAGGLHGILAEAGGFHEIFRVFLLR